MGQLSKFLRKTDGGYAHYCPGCDQLHVFHVEKPYTNGHRWSFNGDASLPTFSPSMNIGPGFCHYFLTQGWLRFQPDCHHKLRNMTVQLPELPAEYRDGSTP